MHSVQRTGRFTIILAVVAVATIIFMTVFLLWQLRLQDLRHAEGETVSLSNIVAEQTTRSLQGVGLALDSALGRLAEAERIGVSVDAVAIHAMLRSRIEGMPQLRSMFIVDAQGMVRNSALTYPPPAVFVGDRDYFVALRDRPNPDLYAGVPLVNRFDGKLTFFFSRRIPSANGKFAGVIAASVDIAYMEALYASIKLDGISPIGLYLNDGTLFARAPHDESLMTQKALLPDMEGKGRSVFTTVRTEGEDAGVTTYRRVSGFPMVLSVGYRDHAALAGWRGTGKMIIAAAAVNILLVLATVAFLLRWQRREAMLAAAAQESHEQLKAMVDSAMDAIITIDSEARVTVFNPAAQRMFGYSVEEVRGKPLDRLLPERFRAVHEQNIAAFGQRDMAARMKESGVEIVGLRADGTEFPLESTVTRVTIGGQTLTTAILRDISERRRAENAVRDSNRQLRELATSLQAVREEERMSIARELHDELGQQLLRLRMDLSWLEGRLKDSVPMLQAKVSGMKVFVAGTVEALRQVTTRLRPPLLDELGLSDAIHWQLDEFAQRTGIVLESAIAIEHAELDERTIINLFRILQESLTNVARHSAATQVTVSLSNTEQRLALEIRDNGCGTEIRDTPELGHGLVGIRERTLLLGGRMEILSAPGAGFTLRVDVPLLAPESAGEQK